MIDRDTWLILAKRLEEIRWHREALEAERETITLVFDSHDQASVLTVERT